MSGAGKYIRDGSNDVCHVSRAAHAALSKMPAAREDLSVFGAELRDVNASPHSITRSAPAISEGGTVRPNSFAVRGKILSSRPLIAEVAVF
jgi:hypothetical protein